MLHIVYSNRLDELAGALAEEVTAARGGGAPDPFAPATVVVPGALVASYVRLALARRLGIAANLRLVFWEPFLAELVERARPAWKVLDRRMMQARLVALLGDPARLDGDELAPVRAYLEAGAADAAAADARRVQLAGAIAGQLLDYTTTRPELVASWSRPRGKVGSPTEAWQRRLWRELVPAGATAAPLATLLAQVPPAELMPPAPPAALHVFGFSFMPRAHHAAVARLAEAARVALYVVNPCRELWDDAGGRAEAAAETPALALWGRPGREHNAALVELGQGDFADRFASPRGDGALARLQRDTLDRAPRRGAADRARAGGDASVRVLACPGPRRELEAVAGMIAAMMVEDATLRASDVALYLAPAEHERYQAQVGAVFDEAGGIPFRLVDRPPGGESRVAEALELLLDLPLGRFARPELLGLMIHPSVLARHPDVDPEDWIRWCDELGIVHGADRRDHKGTYIEQDVYNWDQGLRRLALGSFMAHEPERGPVAVSIGAERYVPARVAPDDRRSAARFAHLARQLVAEARACRAGDRTLTEWAAHLDRLAATYLGAARPADERALDRCREVLRRLEAIDPGGGARVSYATARELLREPLEELRAAGAELPTDAVLVAPLAAMRPLPFRVVFVAGLDAGRFPAGDRESGIDLREGTRRAGDVSPRDRDRYAFLEALMAARDRVVLSYVARDEESGEELEPSSVVHELVEVLGEGYLAPEDAEALVMKLPLRRWSGEPDGAVARRQAASAALRRDLAATCAAAGVPVPGAVELARELQRPERAELAAALGLVAGEAGQAPPGRLARATVAEPLVLSLAALRRFLECPLQGWAAAALGLRDVDDEDLVGQRDEPFERDLVAMTTGLREVFLAHLERGGDLAALLRLHREHAQRDQRTGRAPSGPFAAGAERRGARILSRWRAALEAAIGGLPPARVIGFGAVAEGERVARLDPAIELVVAGHPVRLIGRTEPLAGAAGSLGLITGDDARERHWLRGAIDAVALAAAGLDSAGDAATAVSGHRATQVSGIGRVRRYRFAPLTQDAARAWLAGTLAELFERPHDHLLPCEASVPVARRDRKAVPIAIKVGQLLGATGWWSSMNGPLRLPRGLAAPPDADAIVARRLAVLVAEGGDE